MPEINSARGTTVVFDNKSATVQQAKIEKVLEVVWGRAPIQDLAGYFAEDVVIHYEGESFGYQELFKRAKRYKAITSNPKIKILGCMQADEVLLVKARQLCQLTATNDLCEFSITGSFQIQDEKITRFWLMGGGVLQGEQYSTTALNDVLQPLKLQNAIRQRFWWLVKYYQEMYGTKRVELTPREAECLFGFVKGESAKEMALEMGISPRTVETHILHVKSKYGCFTKQELKQAIFPGRRGHFNV
jgi:DNA-binding CsgD family transcriptional regulator